MSSRYVSCAFYLQKYGITKKDLEGLPRGLIGVHQGAIQRMSVDGVIRRAGMERIDGARRVIWKPGPCYDKVLSWL